MDYPFDDDTLFRGNEATLESLLIGLDLSTIDTLSRLRVFTSATYLKLCYVSVRYSLTLVPSVFATVAKPVQFILRIGPKAAAREIDGVFNYSDIQPALDSHGDHTNIRVLVLSYIGLDIWSVISLIKLLPLLSDLHTLSPSRGPLPDGIALAELPEYIRSNYSPTGERFRCWNLGFRMPVQNIEIAQCVLLLALACPNFDHLVPASQKRAMFMQTIEIVISSDEFRPYAPRLSRLLFHGWNGDTY
ncbi:hypothetical protein IWW38_003411 [Coemansia aciculifera]|uniref:Uncharacterized protein n=1 Tax=Coemansia aciculifera TaxID=417176 RepID=A0ACC1M0G1_9FUNG|nr:hypothetical protein IWW38_003411 [Coemansia aciculifera]